MTQNDDFNQIERCPHDRENPYVQISRDLIRDKNLSPQSRWLIIYILSFDRSWKVQIPYFIKEQEISKDRMYSMLDEAIAAGYIKRESSVIKGLKRYRYFVSETPKFKKCLPCPENPDPVFPDRENQDTTNKQSSSLRSEEKKEQERERKGTSPPPSPISTDFIFKRITIPGSKMANLISDFGEPKVMEMCERLDEFADINPKRFKQYACHGTVLRKWIREEDQKNNGSGSGKSQVNKDKELALKISKAYPNCHEIIVGENHIEFNHGPLNRPYIKFGDNGFRDQVLNNLRKMGIKIV